MKNQKFGVEIEMDNLTLKSAQEIVHKYLGGDFDHLGRKWNICADASVPTGFELVTPPIYYADISTLQEIFRHLRLKGARRSSTTGLHVHVSAEDFSPYQIVSLVNLYASYSDLLIKMLNVYTPRRIIYCRSILPFAQKLNKIGQFTYDTIKKEWYHLHDSNQEISRYDETRYTELNLNSYFYRKTIEFRVFNSTNHAGKIKAFIVLVLAFVHYAKHFPGIIDLKPVLSRDLKGACSNAEVLFSTLALNSSEYRNVRKHLTANLERYYQKKRSVIKRSFFFTTPEGLSFDGGSAAEVVEEMVDNYYFEQDELQLLFHNIRQTKDKKKKWEYIPNNLTLLILELSKSKNDREKFSYNLLKVLETYGKGELQVF